MVSGSLVVVYTCLPDVPTGVGTELWVAVEVLLTGFYMNFAHCGGC